MLTIWPSSYLPIDISQTKNTALHSDTVSDLALHIAVSRDGEAPIFFFHKCQAKGTGHNASYVHFTLKAACLNNPSKTIVFFTDPLCVYHLPAPIVCQNIVVKDVNVLFELVGKLDSHRWEHFQAIFRYVRGVQHTVPESWMRFLFSRYFLLELVMRRNPHITSFWTFDSDVLILDDLRRHESKFQDVNTTTQCKGQCLNGYVRTAIGVLSAYTDSIIKDYEDVEYLNGMERGFEKYPTYAFTEMAAFNNMLRRYPLIATIDASTIISNETFDQALGHVTGPGNDNNNTWVSNGLGPHRMNKKLEYSAVNGSFYFTWAPTLQRVRAIVLNMSWQDIKSPTFSAAVYEVVFGSKPITQNSLIAKLGGGMISEVLD